jgi:hypothetical protein
MLPLLLANLVRPLTHHLCDSIQMGWYPGIVLPDKKTYFPNGGPPGGY